MRYEVEKNKWEQFFNNLGKRRFEWITEVEVLSNEMGVQTLSRGLPLNGITVETVADDTLIDISVGESTGHHQTHLIKNPVRVGFLAGTDNRGDVVDIEEADGTKTLLRFTEPMGVLVGFAEYEVQMATV
jgi:hypothetical protein